MHNSTNNGNSKSYFVFGCISLSAIFITLLINNNLTPDQRFFFKIIFALGSAGVAAVIPGIIGLKYNNPIISASGAIVVFLIVIKLNPPQTKFDLTIFPKSSESSQIVNLGGMQIELNSGFDDAKKVSDGTFKFNDIPNDYFEDSIELSLVGSPQFVFINDSCNIKIKLDNDKIDIPLKKNQKFFQVAGMLYYKGLPLKKIKVLDTRNDENVVKTNESGFFQMFFRTDDNRTDVVLRVDTLNLNSIQIKMGNINYEWNFN